MNTGLSEDLIGAKALVEDAIDGGLRPVDILLGLVSPSLCVIGEHWRMGSISILEQHRFSTVCEKILELVTHKIQQGEDKEPRSCGYDSILMNAYGNSHTLGIRVLDLWLKSRGANVLLLDRPPPLGELEEAIYAFMPRQLLISLALPEQQGGIARIADAIKAMPPEVKPKLVVGGYAVKSGMVAPLPGITFATSIADLESTAPRHPLE